MRIEIKRICVPSDFSQPAERALHYGAALAHEHGAHLHLLHVLQDFGDAVLHPDFTASGEEARVYFNERARAEMQGEELNQGGEGDVDPALRSIKAEADKRFEEALTEKWWEGLTLERALRYGHPAKMICQYAREHEIDLLVIGTHGRTGLKHLLLGSVAERVVRVSPCPVLTVRHPEHEFLIDD